MNNEAALMALLGSCVLAVATVAREILVHFLGRNNRQREDERKEQTSLWHELRGELADLRKEIDAVRTEVDVWKGKYWALMDEHLVLKAEHGRLQVEVNELRQLVNRQREI